MYTVYHFYINFSSSTNINDFHISSCRTGIPSTDVCHDVVVKSCVDDLHYNSTFLTKDDQQKSNSILLQPIIDSKCSPNVEKFLCYSRFPKCVKNDPGVFIPCRSLCEKVQKSCQKEFDKSVLTFPHCNFIFPDDSTDSGLCQIKKWPAPWPKKFRPSLPGECSYCLSLVDTSVR